MFPPIVPPRTRVLVVCPHTDDEFGCAGTVARLIEEGADLHQVALSRCEESVPAGYPRDVLEHECRRCAARLGIPAAQVRVEHFQVRHFPRLRQEILELLVAINRELAPELVLLPSTADTHQDHATIAAEGFRAFKHARILGYELPQNLIAFENTAFVRLTAAHLDSKITSLSEYKSQAFRPYSTEPFIRGLATVRGMQCNATYAEAFQLVRWIM